jgi:hypothetical protein
VQSALQVWVEATFFFNPVSVKFTQATSIKKHCDFKNKLITKQEYFNCNNTDSFLSVITSSAVTDDTK